MLEEKNTRNNGRNCVEVNHSIQLVVLANTFGRSLSSKRMHQHLFASLVISIKFFNVYINIHIYAYTARHKPFSVLRNELFISNLIIIRDEARRIVEQMDVPSWTNNNKKLVRFTTMNQTLRIIIPYIFISFPR